MLPFELWPDGLLPVLPFELWPDGLLAVASEAAAGLFNCLRSRCSFASSKSAKSCSAFLKSDADGGGGDAAAGGEGVASCNAFGAGAAAGGEGVASCNAFGAGVWHSAARPSAAPNSPRTGVAPCPGFAPRPGPKTWRLFKPAPTRLPWLWWMPSAWEIAGTNASATLFARLAAGSRCCCWLGSASAKGFSFSCLRRAECKYLYMTILISKQFSHSPHWIWNHNIYTKRLDTVRTRWFNISEDMSLPMFLLFHNICLSSYLRALPRKGTKYLEAMSAGAVTRFAQASWSYNPSRRLAGRSAGSLGNSFTNSSSLSFTFLNSNHNQTKAVQMQKVKGWPLNNKRWKNKT